MLGWTHAEQRPCHSFPALRDGSGPAIGVRQGTANRHASVISVSNPNRRADAVTHPCSHCDSNSHGYHNRHAHSLAYPDSHSH